MDGKFDLVTPTEAEELFGKGLFYRQRIYRMEKSGKIRGFMFKGQSCYLGHQIIKAVLDELTAKLIAKFPELDPDSLQVVFDDKKKVLVVDGLMGEGLAMSTDDTTEDELVFKVGELVEKAVTPQDPLAMPSAQTKDQIIEDELLKSILTDEILWIRLDVKAVEGVEVRSMVLVSLATVAQYVGVRSYNFTDWINNSVYSQYVLSIHPKQIHAPGNPGAWKRGVTAGNSSFIPFELLPEVLVAFRSSQWTVTYPQKAQMLYELASNTLRAVGLAVGGNKDEAALALAEVGQGLGLDVADQIIGVMKQYASRDYQVKTQKEFSSKVKQLHADYAAVTGTLTLGITGKNATQWKQFGLKNGMKKSQATSAREVMRYVSPSDGVGMTFGEKHYIKQPNLEEATKTGRAGKSFYTRLLKVGLLDDASEPTPQVDS